MVFLNFLGLILKHVNYSQIQIIEFSLFTTARVPLFLTFFADWFKSSNKIESVAVILYKINEII